MAVTLSDIIIYLSYVSYVILCQTNNGQVNNTGQFNLHNFEKLLLKLRRIYGDMGLTKFCEALDV